jgi:hypothetical protein
MKPEQKKELETLSFALRPLQQLARELEGNRPPVGIQCEPVSERNPVQWGELTDGTERLARVQLFSNGRVRLNLVAPPGENIHKLEAKYQRYVALCFERIDSEDLDVVVVH